METEALNARVVEAAARGETRRLSEQPPSTLSFLFDWFGEPRLQGPRQRDVAAPAPRTGAAVGRRSGAGDRHHLALVLLRGSPRHLQGPGVPASPTPVSTLISLLFLLFGLE